MAWFDALRAQWRVPCPSSGEVVGLGLSAFRVIVRLPGPTHPPAFHVRFACPACEAAHVALMPQPVLDLAPLLDPLPPHHDLMVGRMSWAAEGVAKAWEMALRAGHWPLTFQCEHEHRAVGGWPSQLRELEPDRPQAPSRYLVSYDCPQCGRRGVEEWTCARLALQPLI